MGVCTFAPPRPIPRPPPTRCNSPRALPPHSVAVNIPFWLRGVHRRGGGFPALAGGKGNGLSKEEALPKGEEPARGGKTGDSAASGGGAAEGQGTGKDPPRGRPSSAGIQWRELLLDPDPDNVLAVGLTGVLAWASLQVLWQLFVISLAILAAAVKYSFVAALLLFILITLL